MKLFISYRRKSWITPHRLVWVLIQYFDASNSGYTLVDNVRVSDLMVLAVTRDTFAPTFTNMPSDPICHQLYDAMHLKIPILFAFDATQPPPIDLPVDIWTASEIEGVNVFVPRAEEIRALLEKNYLPNVSMTRREPLAQWLPTIKHTLLVFVAIGALSVCGMMTSGYQYVRSELDSVKLTHIPESALYDGNSRQYWCTQSFVGHISFINGAIFSPDKRFVLTMSDDKTAMLWDVETAQLLQTFKGHMRGVYNAIFSPDGSRVLTVSQDTTARVWDVATGASMATFHNMQDVQSIAFSPDGRSILIGLADSRALLWDVATGRLIKTFRHPNSVEDVAFSPDGGSVLTGTGRTAHLWDIASGNLLQTFEGHIDQVNSVAFSPNGQKILTGSTDATARLWDIATGKTLRIFDDHKGSVFKVDFSADGLTATAITSERMALLWDINTGKTIKGVTSQNESIQQAVFSAKGNQVLTIGWDRMVRLWILP